jgi:hypothetical protein
MVHEREIPHRDACFYFTKSGTCAHAVLDLALECFARVGLKPTDMATNLDRGKIVRYQSSKRKLDKLGLDNLAHFNIYAVPEHIQDPVDGFLAAFGFNEERDAYFSIRDGLLSDKLFDEFCLEFADITRPQYGQRRLSPHWGFFAFAGSSIEFHSENCYYTAGFIDNLFPDKPCPWYLLNKYHLQRRIGTGNFADWVAADPARGVLAPYVSESWVWTIPEENTATLMKPLADADILFDRHKHFYPWVWTFAGRVDRGDLERREVIQLLIKHVQETGRHPTPARREQADLNSPWLTDQDTVTAFLKAWGHPAGQLPPPPPPVPMSSEEIVGRILGGSPKRKPS